MNKRRKKVRARPKKCAQKKRKRRSPSVRGAAKIKAPHARGSAGAPKSAASDFLGLTNFIHVDLDSHLSELVKKLQKPQNDVVVLSHTAKEKPTYFLSSSDALRGSFCRVGVKPAPKSSDKPTSVADALGPAMKKFVSGRDTVGTQHKIAWYKSPGNIFVHVEKKKPSTVFVGQQAFERMKLPSAVRSAFVAANPKVRSAKTIFTSIPGLTGDLDTLAEVAPVSVLDLRAPLPKIDLELGPDNEVAKAFEAIKKVKEVPGPAAEPFLTFSIEDSEPSGAPPLHLPPTKEVPAGSGARPPGDSGPPPVEKPGEGHGGPGGPLPPPYAYPNIQVSDEHPVQGCPFNVTVSLDFKAAPKTTGIANVPADNEQHEIDVHLLLGKESRWDKLIFQRPHGTLWKAAFENVLAPALVPGKDNSVPRRIISDIYVNFYLENRWCGEAVAQIDVRESENTDKFTPAYPPPQPAWRRGLRITPGTPPPDLLVRIKQSAPMSFEWSLLSPHMVFNASKEDLSKSYDKPPYGFIKYKFEKFASAEIDAEKRYSLRAICDEIFRAAPIGFHQAYRDLRIAEKNDVTKRIKLETIQFVSDEPYIPWELMRVSDRSFPPAFDPEILSVRHVVGRWIASDVPDMRTGLTVHKIVVFATDYSGLNVTSSPELPGAKVEREFLKAAPYCAQPLDVQYQVLQNYLYNADGKADLAEIIHFSCHGNTDVQDPDEATLVMEDTLNGFKATLAASQEAEAGAGTHHPLVFLNACQAGAEGNAFGFVFGWPQAFLEMGATACVAPLWKVVDSKAKDAAKSFYESVLDASKTGTPLSIGEAVRLIRSKWIEEGSLTNLAYVLYGDPTAKLTWIRPSLDPATKSD